MTRLDKINKASANKGWELLTLQYGVKVERTIAINVDRVKGEYMVHTVLFLGDEAYFEQGDYVKKLGRAVELANERLDG